MSDMKRNIQLKKNPRKNAGFFSIVTFWWLNQFFKKNDKSFLENQDLYEVLEKDSSHEVCGRLEREWSKEVIESKKCNKNPSLFKAIRRTFFSQWLLLGFLTLIEESMRLFSPYCMRGLLLYFEGNKTVEEAYLYAAFIVCIPLSNLFTRHNLHYLLMTLGMHLRVSVTALMYKKTLKLSQKTLGSTSTGKVVNLASSDVLRFDLVTIFLHYIWLAPLQTLVVVYFAWQYIEVSALLGLLVIFFTTFTIAVASKKMGIVRARVALITDKRIRMMNEVLSSMRVIKMYTWEKSFHHVVSKLRMDEALELLKAASLRAYTISMIFVTPKLISLVVFCSYVAMGGQLSASLVFTVLGLFDVIRPTLGVYFVQGLARCVETKISIQRIQDYLLLEEKHEADVDKSSYKNQNRDSVISFDSVCCKWNDSDEKVPAVLKNISFQVENKELIGVVGPTGSGKSSLLMAMLRELCVTSGSVCSTGQISYCSQVPWLFYGTLRDNILFGEDFVEDKYKKVVAACSLLPDFQILNDGDLTMIGEKGISLSGGQKARVNLARCAYRSSCDVYLLDDPLSALDAKVARKVFDECICTFLKDKTRIVVTHQVSFLNNADKIAVLKEGNLLEYCKYDELKSKKDLNELVSSIQQEKLKTKCENKSDSTSDIAPKTDEFKENNNRQKSESFCDSYISSGDDELEVLVKVNSDDEKVKVIRKEKSKKDNSEKPTDNKTDFDDESTEFAGESIQLLPQKSKSTQNLNANEELKATGGVKSRIFMKYFGWNKFLLFCVVILAVVNHSSLLVADWWIAHWATKANDFLTAQEVVKKSPTYNTSIKFNASYTTNSTYINSTQATSISAIITEFDNSFYLNLYIGVCLSACIFMILRFVFQFRYCVRAGIRLHDRMFKSILHTTVRFFDVNPVGRILNRFSKDLGLIDELMPGFFMDFIYLFVYTWIVLTVACLVNPLVIIPILPIVVCFTILRQYYVRRSRDIKRLEGNNRSPIFSHLSNTLEGLTTVRAFNMQENFENKFHQMQDLHSASWFLFMTSSRWFGQRLDSLCVIFIASVAYLSILHTTSESSPGNVGLTLTYALSLIGMFQYCVTQSTEVENLMTSVERMQAYSDLPSEVTPGSMRRVPPKTWPQNGTVSFDKLCFSHYRGGPDILKDLTFSIGANEKVGVIGRTGAGKSSLIAAIYRLNVFSSGEIFIDGIPVSNIELKNLRSALSIIPQDPRLFYGTIRFNMDPLSVYTDDELWTSLEKVQLKSRVSNYKLKLLTQVNEGGSNFSVGERQLFCLARAILRKSKIVLIDEATANVDLETDRLIQKALRESLQECTVITIAHRINTIIDCNKVLVMDKGNAVEFGEPYKLIKQSLEVSDEKKKSFLYSMMQSYGEQQVKELIQLASEAHFHRQEEKKN